MRRKTKEEKLISYGQETVDRRQRIENNIYEYLLENRLNEKKWSFEESIKHRKITFKGKYIYGIFLFPISYSAFFVFVFCFFLSSIHFLLRLILERACGHDDGVNHFAPESCRCILSPITISFLSLYSLTRLLDRCLCICAFIFPHLLLFTFFPLLLLRLVRDTIHFNGDILANHQQ